MKENVKNSKDKIAKTLVIMVLCGAVIAGIYLMITNKPKSEEGVKSQTEYDKLIAKNLEVNYPASPREVVKLYSRMIQCLYGTNLEQNEIEKMAGQMRKLFDTEFLAGNPEKEYLKNMEEDINDYRKNKRVIMNYDIQDSSTLETKTIDKKEYTTVDIAYSLKEKKGVKKTIERYMLRKDTNGKWKILGWELNDNPVGLEAD